MMALALIAARNLARNPRRTALALVAVVIGVGIMVGIHGFMDGLANTLREEVIEGSTGAIVVHRAGYLKQILGSPLSLDVPADEAFLATIRAVPHVKAVAARLTFGGMANAGDTTGFAMLLGLDPVAERKVCPRRETVLSAGAGLDAAHPDAVVLSEKLARALSLALGDRAALLAADADGVLNGVDVKLAGTLGPAALPGAEQKLGFLSLSKAQELVRLPGRGTEIGVALDDMNALDATRDAIQAAVGPRYEVSTWHDIAGFVDEAIADQRAILGVVLTIFLVVALFGIANTMLMNVLERTREIGTMMAVGVRRRQIVLLFLFEAAVLGLVGAVIGGALGMGADAWFHAHPLKFSSPTGGALVVRPLVDLLYAARTALVGSIGAAIAALYPSWKASRMRPVEALAHV